MPKDQTIPGMHLLSGSLKMCAEVGGEPNLSSCVTLIVKSLQSTLRLCGFFPVVATCITQDGHTKPTITVTFSEQKKTPEKSGAT